MSTPGDGRRNRKCARQTKRMGMLVAGVLLASGLAPVASAAIPAESARGARPAQVNRISPKTGPDEGGTRVLIKGQNFKNVRAVKFGRTRSPEFQVISPRRIVAVAPPGTGRVHVWVVKRSGALSPRESDDVFRYSGLGPAPLITNIGPGSGSRFGGETVTIDGEYLGHVTSVTFGDVESPDVDVVSDNQITAVTPAYPNGGVVDIVVTNRSGSSSQAEGAPTFTFLDPPEPASGHTITGVSPGYGPTAGGTSVTVTGKQLGQVTALTVDGVPALFDVLSPTRLAVTMPPHAAGTIQLRATGPGGTTPAWNTDQFTYTDDDGPVATAAPLPPDATGTYAPVSAVDCPAEGLCTAVGFYAGPAGHFQPYALQLDDGVWTPSPMPHTANQVQVEDVACSSASHCLAVGTQANDFNDPAGDASGYAAVWDGAGWAEVAWEDPGASAVSCGTSRCAAVGRQYDVQEDAVRWVLAVETEGGTIDSSTSDVTIPAVSPALTCSGALACVAYASDSSEGPTQAMVLSGGTWSPTTLPQHEGEDVALSSLDCPAAAQCVGLGTAGDDGVVVRYAAGTWTVTAPDQPFETGSIDCVSTTQCTAFGVRREAVYPPPGCGHCHPVNYFYGTSSSIGDNTASSTSKELAHDSSPFFWVSNGTTACSTSASCGAFGTHGGSCMSLTLEAGELVKRTFGTQGGGRCDEAAGLAASSPTTAVGVGSSVFGGPSVAAGMIVERLPLR